MRAKDGSSAVKLYLRESRNREFRTFLDDYGELRGLCEISELFWACLTAKISLRSFSGEFRPTGNFR